MGIVLFLMLIGAASAVERYPQGCDTNEVDAAAFLRQYNTEASTKCNFVSLAQWNYQNNLTENNKNAMLEALQRNAVFHKEMWQKATSFAWKNFSDPQVKRQFQKLSVLGDAILPEEKFKELNKLGADMEDIYSKATVKSPCGAQSLSLDPDLTKLFATSRNPDELKCYWEGWRDATGKKMRESYLRFVELSNEAARANGFNDTGEFWREPYESDTFESEVDELWQQVRPLYELLHAYVRKKLAAKYGESVVKPNGPIPAHLLGSLWAENWSDLYSLVEPFQCKLVADVSEGLEARNSRPLDLFAVAEDFFKSLDFEPLTPEVWHYSIFDKPDDRCIDCHPDSFDMCTTRDFRIRQCSTNSMASLLEAHRQLGRVEYMRMYSEQPFPLRASATPALLDALGDMVTLSVSTPCHLFKIGLLDKVYDDQESDINYLMRVALEKVAFLPFAYSLEKWRWAFFQDKIRKDNLTYAWWDTRLKHQGVCAPEARCEDDLDPASYYDVIAHRPTIQRFLGTLLQFQLHKAFCEAANHIGPLHKCDLFHKQEISCILKRALKLGSSKPPCEVLHILTYSKSHSVEACGLQMFFQPLTCWLKEHLKCDKLGWEDECSATHSRSSPQPPDTRP